MSSLLSRKFLICLATLAVSAVLCVTGDLSSGDYKLIVIATVGAYITGNVLQKKNEQQG